MAISRYTASQDTTITNAYRANLLDTDRGTGSNMGLADTLQIFSLYGQASGSNGYSQELSRILLKFPVTDISNDRSSGLIPSSGNVSFYLKMFNVEHGQTLPKNAKLNIVSMNKDWEEGNGKDLEEYRDITRDGEGANWINASSGTPWTTVGGDYNFSEVNYTYDLPTGVEDIEQDITGLVEGWVSDGNNNYGIGIHLTSSQEAYFSSSLGSNSGSIIQNASGSQTSYYLKSFFARSSEHFFRRPYIEARWNSSEQDDRGNVYFSSSLANSEDNLNTIYLYNYIRGRLRDIPGLEDGKISVSLYSGSLSGSGLVHVPTGSKLLMPVGGGVQTSLDTNITGGIKSTGIYTASFALTSSTPNVDLIFDVWHSASTEYFTGSFEPKYFPMNQQTPSFNYYTKITNLNDKYSYQEVPRIRVYSRLKNWSPTIYNKVVNKPENNIIHSGAYEIYRVSDNKKVIPFGTGSDLHTMMSYDVSGNYFDLDMSLLEQNYQYGIRLSYFNDERNSWDLQRGEYKFRVE